MVPNRKQLQNRTDILAAVLTVALLYTLIFIGCGSQPTPPPTPTPVPTVAPTTVPTPTVPTVYFDPGSTQLKPTASAVLDPIVASMAANPSAALTVNGYTSAMGTETDDMTLSMQRDQAVAEYLEAHGVPSTRITLSGYGKTAFVATNKTPQGRALNDRVELIEK